jgi:hypothetical protein
MADVRQRRGTDTVIAFQPVPGLALDMPVALDRFVEGLGLSGIGDQWREINREAAVSLATAFLARDLAYHSQLMNDEEARTLAERFASVFGADARFFTNTDFAAGASSWGWMPLTESTFDAGLVGADASLLGALVVQDED